METVLVLIGVGCIIGAIIGGGLKLQVLEMGKLDSLWRQGLLGAFGVVLTLSGLAMGGRIAIPKVGREVGPSPRPPVPTPKPTAPTPKPTAPTPKPTAPTPKPTDAALELADDYWRGLADADASKTVDTLYGDRVRYYGRVMDRDAVVREKMDYFRRVPIRRYSMEQAAAQCEGGVCTVTGVVNWSGAAAEGSATSAGASRFTLAFKNGKVVSESLKPL